MPRKLKFIAWDTKNRILKRLGKVEMIKGELLIKNHIVLQFTGHFDKLGKEIYENDVLLSDGKTKRKVIWSDDKNGWSLEENGRSIPFDAPLIKSTTRLYNYHEQRP